jgi:hypothetical protein
MKKMLGALALLTVLAIFPLTSQAAPLKNLSWRAEYYANPDLAGQPKLSRYEDAINHDWGHGAPSEDIPSDNFSARWTLTRHFDQGTYLFLLSVDDGARVWLDGKLIIDAWKIARQEDLKFKLYLDKTGDHELQVAYFENTGQAMIKFDWLNVAAGDAPVGAWDGAYFNNKDLSGAAVVVRKDSKIDFDWNSGSPSTKIARDNFSVRWTRSLYLEEGDYKLRIQHDDGMRIYVDEKQVYDSWYDQSIIYETLTLRLSKGTHSFKVEYYEHLGNAVVKMVMDNDSGNGGQPKPGSGDVVLVDNRSAGFQWNGPASNRYVSCGGCYGSDFFWTYNTANTPTNSGQWTPSLKAGDYEVFVYIPGVNATTRTARYRLQHDGVKDERIVNQSRFYSQWVSLGTYHFTGNGSEAVILYDNTSEAEGSTQVAFDAVKFVKH